MTMIFYYIVTVEITNLWSSTTRISDVCIDNMQLVLAHTKHTHVHCDIIDVVFITSLKLFFIALYIIKLLIVFFFITAIFFMIFFFFFQAEDGIRDYKVTGVQTCALPI